MPKSAERIALDELVKFFCHAPPRRGYDESSLPVTHEQAATVLAAEPEIADDVLDDYDARRAHFVAKLACHPGPQSDALSAAYEQELTRRLWKAAQGYLLYLVNAELEERAFDRMEVEEIRDAARELHYDLGARESFGGLQ